MKPHIKRVYVDGLGFYWTCGLRDRSYTRFGATPQHAYELWLAAEEREHPYWVALDRAMSYLYR